LNKEQASGEMIAGRLFCCAVILQDFLQNNGGLEIGRFERKAQM